MTPRMRLINANKPTVRPSTASAPAVTRSLSSVGGGAVAAVAFGAAAEGGPGGCLFSLDADGGTIDVSQRLRATGTGARFDFAPLRDNDPRVFVASDGSDQPVVGALDDALAPATLWAGDLRGSAVALVEDDDRIVTLMEAIDGLGQPSQTVMYIDLAAKHRSWITVDSDRLDLSSGRVITALAAHAGYVYAAVSDPARGCDLFRIALSEFRSGWTPIFTRGAGRFALNAAVSSFAQYGDSLLVGMTPLATGPVSVGNWGPELLMVEPDGSWDLIIGQLRPSANGLRVPASGLPPGIDSADNASIAAIATGKVQGRRRAFFAVQGYSGPVPGDRIPSRPLLGDYRGVVRLFSSENLIDWTDLYVTLPDDAGTVTSLCVTESGVIVGHEGKATDGAPVTFVRVTDPARPPNQAHSAGEEPN